MTEQDWFACRDPMRMLTFLDDRLTTRKRQFFALACHHSLKCSKINCAIGSRSSLNAWGFLS